MQARKVLTGIKSLFKMFCHDIARRFTVRKWMDQSALKKTDCLTLLTGLMVLRVQPLSNSDIVLFL